MKESALKKLQRQGKIRSYNTSKTPSEKRTGTARKSKALTILEANLEQWCQEKDFELRKEYQFHPVRKFRLDYAIVNLKLAIEFEGGIFLKKSGHNTAIHYTKDCDKYNLLLTMGWKVLRYTALNYKNVIDDLNELVQ